MSHRMELEDRDAPVVFTKKQSDVPQNNQVDMTPMVDVVFQLLTFFLLAVKRDTAEPLDVPVTDRSDVVPAAASLFITMKPNPKGSGEAIIIIGDKKGDGETVKIEKIKEAIENAINEDRTNIIIKAEKTVRHGDFIKVSKLVSNIPKAKLYCGVQTRD
jgi:biopolymer transport protein ExbD